MNDVCVLCTPSWTWQEEFVQPVLDERSADRRTSPGDGKVTLQGLKACVDGTYAPEMSDDVKKITEHDLFDADDFVRAIASQVPRQCCLLP